MSSIDSTFATAVAPFAVNDSGSKSAMSVKRQDSWVVSGNGSAR